MKSAKTILIAAAVLFATLSLRAPSAEQEEDSAGAKVVPTAPVRPALTPARPPSPSEEEAPIPKPVTRTPTRTTPTRPSAARTTPRRPVRPAEDPHKDTVIFVEAFMVEVKLSALRSLGVPEISEGCKSLSAEQIIKLIKTTDAAVLTAGAKLSVGHNNKAETKSRTHQSMFFGEPDKKVVRREYVDVGTTFSAYVIIRPGQQIYMDIGFEHSGVEEGDDKIDAVLAEREWTSSVTLKDGKPTLVGSIAGKETGTFLIVTANIKE